jgi:hypothetical protein
LRNRDERRFEGSGVTGSYDLKECRLGCKRQNRPEQQGGRRARSAMRAFSVNLQKYEQKAVPCAAQSVTISHLKGSLAV